MALTTARVNAAVDGAVSTITHMRMHTGAPGAAGTSNVAANAAVTAIDFSAASSGAAEDTVTVTISGAQASMTHVSLWVGDPGSGGTFAGDGEVSPAESFAGAGTLDVKVTVTGTAS